MTPQTRTLEELEQLYWEQVKLVKRYRVALELAAIRLQIMEGRARGCHEETGNHELMEEAEMFTAEAREALKETS